MKELHDYTTTHPLAYARATWAFSRIIGRCGGELTVANIKAAYANHIEIPDYVDDQDDPTCLAHLMVQAQNYELNTVTGELGYATDTRVPLDFDELITWQPRSLDFNPVDFKMILARRKHLQKGGE